MLRRGKCSEVPMQNYNLSLTSHIYMVKMYMKALTTLRLELRHEISNNVICTMSNGSDQPAHTRSLIRALASRLNILCC